MKNKHEQTLPTFLDELLGEDIEETLDFTQVRSRAASAMNMLMLQNQQNYLIELEGLARACADLLNQDYTTDSIVHEIKSSMAASYERILNKVTSEIGLGQFQMNKTNPHTIGGRTLESHIKAMKKYKEKPLSEITEAVVTDALVRANNQFNADLGDFNFMHYQDLL